MTPTRERRITSPGDLRADPAKPRRLVGHAAVFDRWTVLHQSESFVWREVVRPGAFRRAIAERQDVRALFNHDSNFILGRTSAGTLRLREDGTGLAIEIDAPDSATIRDLVLAPIARGDVTQMSFAFTAKANGQRSKSYQDSSGRLVEERELVDVDLFDVSPVTYPAYSETDVAIRERAAERETALRRRRDPNNVEYEVFHPWPKGKGMTLRYMRMRLLECKLRGGL